MEKEFNESLIIIKPLQNKIYKIDEAINQLVYLLYNLSAEDIAIIENSFKEYTCAGEKKI